MCRILLLEDNADMQSLLRDLLEWGGHSVVAGRSGKEGLDALHMHHEMPDVIISDVTMPHMDGVAFLQAVRQNPNWQGLPFILMSANPYDERLDADVLAHSNGVLRKPFSLEELDQLLNQL
ncbi:MAG: response regulator [Anaerolineae bacterium]|nr:response regulator [Anaerolineae bacterium]